MINAYIIRSVYVCHQGLITYPKVLDVWRLLNTDPGQRVQMVLMKQWNDMNGDGSYQFIHQYTI